MFSPSENHRNAEKGNLPTQASDDQIRYCWQNSKQEIIIIHSKGWALKSMLWSLEIRYPISLILAQSPSSPSLTFLCHSSLYHLWLPSEMSILSHSYLPNLQVLLLLPSFANLLYMVTTHKYNFHSQCKHTWVLFPGWIDSNIKSKTIVGVASWHLYADYVQGRKNGHFYQQNRICSSRSHLL